MATTRQLEGQARRGQRPGRGDRAGAPGRAAVAGTAIPPAMIGFHGAALVRRAGSSEARARLRELASRIPKQRQAAGAVLEVVPEGEFPTCGLGIGLPKLLDPAAAQARVPVTQEERTR